MPCLTRVRPSQPSRGCCRQAARQSIGPSRRERGDWKHPAFIRTSKKARSDAFSGRRTPPKDPICPRQVPESRVGLGAQAVQRFVVSEGWRSLRRKKVPLVSKSGRSRRLERARKLLNKLKESGYAGRIVFYSDEKNFVVDPVYNAQKDWYINFFESDKDEEDCGDGRYIARSKHPASALLLGAVASTGEVSPPIWFPTGFRLAADAFIEVLNKTLVPWMRRVSAAHGGVPFVFQQDSAPAHRAKKHFSSWMSKGSNIEPRRSGLLTPLTSTLLTMESGPLWPRGCAVNAHRQWAL